MRITALLGVVGAGLGAGVAVIVHFTSTAVSYTGYSPRRYFGFVRVRSGHPSWAPMLPLWIVGGLIVGLLVGDALTSPGGVALSTRVRLLAPPAVLGALVGLALGALVPLHGESDFHGFYAPLNDGIAYGSSLSVTDLSVNDQFPHTLSIGGGLGLLAGVALGALAVLVRVRVSASSPSGSTRR